MSTPTGPSASDDDILVSSRSFLEYQAFFDLDPQRLPARILDCCAGASGFVAEAQVRGVDAVAVDPIYGLDADSLAVRLTAGAASGTSMIDANSDRFSFDWYGTPERRAEMRRLALSAFLADHRANPERYVDAALPELPFADASFDLALCSHLLFTWATHLDEQWHVDALVELCRVAAEVRVFPLVLQGAGRPVAFLPRLQLHLREAFGIQSEVVAVPYEFQVGAHHMLRLQRQDQAQ